MKRTLKISIVFLLSYSLLPFAIRNVYASTPELTCGTFHTVGLKTDGTVVAVGYNSHGQCNVGGWTNIQQVAAGCYHTVGLKTDGTVVAVGSNYFHQCDVNGWTDIKQIAAGHHQTVGVKTDGTVVAVGYNSDGQCDVGGWTNIQQVTTGENHTAGLKSDGTVVCVGDNYYYQCNVGGWTDIKQVAAGHYHTVGLKTDGTVVAAGSPNSPDIDVGGWTDIKQIAAGYYHTVGVKSDGRVVDAGFNPDVNASGWTNIQQVATGQNHTVGLKTDGTVVAIGDNSAGQLDVDGWNLGTSTFYDNSSITISNVEGGAVVLEGIWRVDLYDADGKSVKQYHSSTPSFEMMLPTGTYTAKVFFLYDDGQGIWEFWGKEEFSVTSSGTYVAFTRNMPWLATIGPYKSVLAPGATLSVSCTLKNDLSTSVEVALEGQIGAGNVMTGDTITISANSSAAANFQFANLPDSGIWPLRYWVKAIPPGESVFTITDHSVIDGYLSYNSDSIQASEYVCMDYIDQAGNLWQIGFDINKSNDEWFFDPQNTFKNIKYYKNGSKVTPSDAELQMLLDRVAHYFSSFYPSIIIGEKFDTSYGIWRQPCGFSWACHSALIDFDDYERKTIYKELLWEAVTCRNHPYLNTEYRIPDDDAYIASALSLDVATKIDEFYERYKTAIGVDITALNRFRKLMHIAELSQSNPILANDLNAASKTLGKAVSMLKIANKVGDVAMHTVQNIVMMDFLAATGFAENRIATIKEAYNYVKNNIEPQVDPIFGQAIAEIESDFEDGLSSLGDAIVTSFLQVVWDDLGDPNYVKQKLINMADGSKLAKKLVGTVAKNFKLSRVAVATVVMDGIKTITTVMDLGDDWRRIILSGMLSKVTVLYAQNDPTWLASTRPANGIMTAEAMRKHQVRDVYDLQSVFAFEYLSRGLGLVDSGWNSVLQDAIDSTLDQATSPPYTYPINYASTAVVFGQQVGIAANNLVYSDSLEAARDMLKSIVDGAEKKNRVVNEWAEMMAKSQIKAMPWIPLLLLGD